MITNEDVKRILADKKYWYVLARNIILQAETSETRCVQEDSSFASASNLPASPKSRMNRAVAPQAFAVLDSAIAEVQTVSGSRGVLLTEEQARKLKRRLDRRAFRRAQRIQNADSGIGPLMDHPGQSCDDAHPNQSHNDYLDAMDDSEEEEKSQR